MQINSRNFEWLGLSLQDAFDPCASVRAGATVLTQLSRYNTGSPRAGFSNGYVARVLASKGAAPPIAAAPPPPPHDPDVWREVEDIESDTEDAEPVLVSAADPANTEPP